MAEPTSPALKQTEGDRVATNREYNAPLQEVADKRISIKEQLSAYATAGQTIEFLNACRKYAADAAEVIVANPKFADTLAKALVSPYADQLIDTEQAAHVLMRAVRQAASRERRDGVIALPALFSGR
jgi:hypothetical protein